MFYYNKSSYLWKVISKISFVILIIVPTFFGFKLIVIVETNLFSDSRAFQSVFVDPISFKVHLLIKYKIIAKIILINLYLSFLFGI